MMHLTLSPQRGLPGQPETTISVSGDTIAVDGTAHDLSAVPEGGEATPLGDDHPFAGKIRRKDGAVHVGIRVMLDDTAKPNQPTDRAHWIIPDAEGAVRIPAIRKEDADA